MLDMNGRTAYDTDHDMFRDTVRKVLDKVMVPKLDEHEANGIVGRQEWRDVGAAGLLCCTVPEEYGGLGLDFRYNAVVAEELGYLGSSAGFTLQSDVLTPYIETYGSEAQKQRYLPRMVSGDLVTAIAMTEPGTGSDLQGIRTTARRDGNEWVINGSKTYITNGQNAEMILAVCRTGSDEGAKGLSLMCIDVPADGFRRGRNLDKVGQHGADTSELFFDDLRMPAENILGEEGMGFACLMNKLPQERLTIAISAQAAAQRAFDEAVKFTRERKAFGQTIFDFQNTRFTLGDLKTKLQVGWAHIDWALERHIEGALTASEASAAKLWHTELQGEICDASLQLHGGAGYMNEYPIARLWRDARVTRIYGGTSEIMKEMVSRSI